MVHSLRSYKVEPRDGKFVVVSEQDGSAWGSFDDEEDAKFSAEESYCDDGAMIRHEDAS